jgi:hypothetical protein
VIQVLSFNLELDKRRYEASSALGHEPLFYICMGSRRVGKSFNWKGRVIKKFIQKGHEFIWIRRTIEEINGVQTFGIQSTWGNDICPKLGVDYEGKRGEIFLNGDKAGYFMGLSQAMKKKGHAFPNVMTIVFDEFMLEGSGGYYLKDEGSLLLTIVDTVFGDREDLTGCRVVCLANNISWNNPMFEFFNVPYFEERFKKVNYGRYSVLVENYIANDEFLKMKNNTSFGQLISDTAYGMFSMDNLPLEDTKAFVDTIPKNAKQTNYAITMFDYTIFFYWNGKTMTISLRGDKGKIASNYTLVNKLHNVDYFLINSKDNIIKSLRRLYNAGRMRFDSLNTKSKTLLLFNFI